MGRSGEIINKFSLRGKLVKAYNSVSEAVKAENTTRYYLTQSIASGKILNGHVFSSEDRPPVPKKVVNLPASEKEPEWCGRDGFFNVDGWAKCCL